jgi:hypothetical protein
MDARKRAALFCGFSPVGWEAVGPYSPERSRRNRFGFKFVWVVFFVLPKQLRRALKARG